MAKAVKRKPGMNAYEAYYASVLDERVRLGEVVRFSYERHRLVLGDRCTYTPDFEVWLSNGELEFHEVKGFWRDDARVKLKAAATAFPQYRFVAVYPRKRRGTFTVEKMEEIAPAKGT